MTGRRLNGLVLCIYLISAYIFSTQFGPHKNFTVSDSSNYIAWFMGSKNLTYPIKKLADCYMVFDDSSSLYTAYLTITCGFANKFLGGANVYYMTLLQTAFGIFSANVLYRFIKSYVSVKRAFKFTMLFACCSLFLFYSCVIIRDIVIAYFYMLSIEIVLTKTKYRYIILLVLFAAISLGIRLYSGLFQFSFVFVFLYSRALQSKNKAILTPLILGLMIFCSAYLLVSDVMAQTESELELYSNMSQNNAEKGQGLVLKILKFPAGIKQVVLFFYTQITPLPPFGFLEKAKNIQQLFMASTVPVYEFFWYLIAYTMFCCIFCTKKVLRRFSVEEKMLFALTVIFIIAGSSHPDIRRMMPMYPVFYVIYIKFKEYIVPKTKFSTIQTSLIVFYVCLLGIYYGLKVG